MLNYKPMIGDDFDYVAQCALDLSIKKAESVKFTFNGEDVFVCPANSIPSINNQYKKLVDKNYQRYIKSDEYKKHQKEQEKRNKRDQEKIDILLNQLHPKMDQHEVVIWCGVFAEVNDNIDLKYNKQEIADVLKANGYKSNDCIGADMEDKDNFAKWLVGQSISMLESGMPIHPQIRRFAKEYIEKFA